MFERKFQRILLNADVLITDTKGKKTMCHCVEFSDDGIDLEPLQLSLIHMSKLFHAGQIVKIQVQGIDAAPKIEAAIIRSSMNSLSLRFVSH
jgi:hypothetical protein